MEVETKSEIVKGIWVVISLRMGEGRISMGEGLETFGALK